MPTKAGETMFHAGGGCRYLRVFSGLLCAFHHCGILSKCPNGQTCRLTLCSSVGRTFSGYHSYNNSLLRPTLWFGGGRFALVIIGVVVLNEL